MKKKNGFTLIELLAVIVILAIIMVIATIEVNKTIKTSRNNADNANKEVIKKAIKTCILQENDVSKCDKVSKLVDEYIDEIGDPYSKLTVSKDSQNKEALDDKYIIEIEDVDKYVVLSMLGDLEKVQKEKTLYLLNKFDQVLSYASKRAPFYFDESTKGGGSWNVAQNFEDELNSKFKSNNFDIKLGQTDVNLGWRVNIEFKNSYSDVNPTYLSENEFNKRDVCYYYKVHYYMDGKESILPTKFDSMISPNGSRYVKPYFNKSQFTNSNESKTNCNPNIVLDKKHLQ